MPGSFLGGDGLSFDENMLDLRMQDPDGFVQAVDRRCRFRRRQLRTKGDFKRQQYVLRPQMHGECSHQSRNVGVGRDKPVDAGARSRIDAFADEQPLAFVGEKHRHQRENDADDDGGDAVEHRHMKGMPEEDAEEGNDQPKHGRRVLEEHGERCRILALPDRGEVAEIALALAELTKRNPPGAALEDHRQGQDDIVDRWIARRRRLLDVHDPFIKRNTAAHGEDQNRDNERPEIKLLAAAKRMLVIGRQSALPPNDEHPFGRGKELYFWTLVVAILIFAVGGGISLYEGIVHIQEPAPSSNPTINYVVLTLAMIFEGGAWWIAFREFRKSKGDLGYFAAVRESKDPTTFTVLFEDTAAMLGLIVAFLGVFFGHALHMPVLDGVASVVIGVILALVAVFLAYESKGLLIGEGVDARTRASINRLVASDPDITTLV